MKVGMKIGLLPETTSGQIYYMVCDAPDGGGANNGDDPMGMDIISDSPTEKKSLQTDRSKRVAEARARVRGEMEASRKSVETFKALNRRFDTFEIEEYLPVAAKNILSAFLQIKKWTASHVSLFAHAYGTLFGTFRSLCGAVILGN